MRRFLLILIVILTVHVAYAQRDHKGIVFDDITLEEALKRASSPSIEKKMVFLDCYTSWCIPCKQMAVEVFTKEEVGEWFNSKFINIKIDMEKGAGPSLVKKYNIKAYPTFLVLDNLGNEIGRVVGGATVEEFMTKIKKATDLKNSPTYFRTLFEKSKNVNAARDYLQVLEKSFMEKEASAFLATNIDSLDIFEVLQCGLWRYISSAATVRGADVTFFQRYIERNKAYLSDKEGYDKVNKTLLASYHTTLCDYFDAIARNENQNDFDIENLKKAAEYTKLLVAGTENPEYVISTIAGHYLRGDIAKIIKMYWFLAYRNLSLNHQLRIEKVFLSIKEIPKEKHDYYKKSKLEYMQKRLPN